jgi:phosphoribosylanthranilate isomerase
VGLFMNAEPAVQCGPFVAQVRLHLLQFHGDEDRRRNAPLSILPYIKAVPMGANAEVRDYERRFATAAGLAAG